MTASVLDCVVGQLKKKDNTNAIRDTTVFSISVRQNRHAMKTSEQLIDG